MWLSGTEVNIDFQSSIIDPSKKKLSNFEKELATHSSVLAWRIPWMEKPGRVPWGCTESDTTEAT